MVKSWKCSSAFCLHADIGATLSCSESFGCGLDFVLVFSWHTVGLIKVYEMSVESVVLNDHPGCTGSICRCFILSSLGEDSFYLIMSASYWNPLDSVPL